MSQVCSWHPKLDLNETWSRLSYAPPLAKVATWWPLLRCYPQHQKHVKKCASWSNYHDKVRSVKFWSGMSTFSIPKLTSTAKTPCCLGLKVTRARPQSWAPRQYAVLVRTKLHLSSPPQSRSQLASQLKRGRLQWVHPNGKLSAHHQPTNPAGPSLPLRSPRKVCDTDNAWYPSEKWVASHSSQQFPLRLLLHKCRILIRPTVLPFEAVDSVSNSSPDVLVRVCGIHTSSLA